VLVRRTFCAEFEFGVQRAVNVATSYCVAECSFFLAKREIVLRLLTDQPATQLPLYIVGLEGWKTAQKRVLNLGVLGDLFDSKAEKVACIL